jgi:hypothetical protein
MISLMPPSDERFKQLPPALQIVLLTVLGTGTLIGAAFVLLALLRII